MTIEEMRKEMRREVVPEEVVPQNVINCLIDEEAEPSKPDAFSFLTRLRALGIGSGDFIDLLEGCDAPESVVNKIKQNPAMNLQGLIMTLENSELTPDDYTRMLLTARQVWERTLTMRLEKSEKISQEVDISEDADDETVKVYGGEARAEYVEDEPVSEEDDDYDEDLLDMSFTAILDKITAETLGEAPAGTATEPGGADDEEQTGPESADDQEQAEPESADEEEQTESESADEEEQTESESAVEEEQTEPESAAEEQPEESADSSDKELTFTAAFDKIKAEKRVAQETVSETGEVSEGTALVEINSDLLRENFEKFSGVLELHDEEALEEPVKTAKQKQPEESAKEDKAPEKPVKTAKQKRSEESPEEEAPEKPVKTAKQKKPERTEEEADEADETSEENESSGNGYHTGALIGATVGAAVLICAGFYIGNQVGKNVGGIHYAGSAQEIFDKIYDAYSASTAGGDLAVGLEEDHNAIFGDLLIDGDGEKGVSSFAAGAGLYSLTEEAISVDIVENGTVTPLDDLLPPENSRFVAAFDSSGELYALFSGTQSGYMKIADGKELYTVLQDGVLTSYELSDGEIRLGTVYTPVFRSTFTINDEDIYLPKLGAGVPVHISADKVIVSETKGYSYGVSAGYSADNGSVKDACAVIGDPVSASVNGRFALNGENGVLIKTDGDKITKTETAALVRAAFGENVCAVIEESDPQNIKLLDGEFKTASILTGVTDAINVMRFDGSLLTISCKDSVFRVDCADPGAPEPIKLRTVNGIIAGQSALTFEANGTALLITRYDVRDGKAEKACEYSKELTSAAKLGDPKTAVIDGKRSGIAYSWFDGVSVISEYAVFADGEQPETVSVFDDRTGFTAAFSDGGAVNAVCAGGVKVL